MTNKYGLAVAIAFFIGVTAWIGTAHSQAGQAGGQRPAGAPAAAPAGQRGAPGTENGIAIFQTQCVACHGNPNVDRAPSPAALREMPPERIFDALTSGVMKDQGNKLSDQDKRGVAEFMSGRPLGSGKAGDAKSMANQCRNNPPLSDPSRGPAWNGWGSDISNSRFQSAQVAGLTAAQVPRLKLRWAFGFPSGVSANAQPTIASGRVFVGSDNGYVYSLDAATGCVYWSFENGSIVRNALTVGPVSGQGNARYAVYFGDGRADVFALDAQNGRLLWKTKVDPHFVARITAGSRLYNGVLFVPVSSSEEFRSGNPDYPCCTSRGSVVALDANTGKQIWKAWVVPDEPRPYKTMTNGVTLYKPAGGAVWNSPTIDPVRNAVYFGTGDATTAPSPKTTDGIMAVNIKTGEFLWAYQATENDVFMGGCNGPVKSEACPEQMGPDMDIGNSPILKTLSNGKRVLIAGTKGGDVFGLDPDDNGKLLYRINVGGAPVGTNRGGRGSIVWGGASDDQFVYYGAGGAGLVAVRPATGERGWAFTPPPPANGGRGASLGAAPTVIPGVVFEGASDGKLYAISTADGKQLWEFNTAQSFDTANKVPAHGGAISSSGAVVVGGMVYVGSGYAISSAASAGNVLLAFGVE
jgi:polyvinyl alcohol dehydrogenase (cytochrome)